MATYKIQQGQSLGQIARDNNTTISNLMSLNPQIKNANLIYSGQEIQVPSTDLNIVGSNANSTLMVNNIPGQIDLNTISNSVVPSIHNTNFIGPVKPTTNNTTDTINNTNTISTIDTTNNTSTKTSNNTFNEIDNELSAINNILQQRNTLQTEVSDLENKIANRSKIRDEALTTAGVYDDIKTLNDLKTKQQQLEEEARLYLVGKAGTKAGLASLTNLESRQALLQEQQLQNRVNTNLSIIDQKLKADNDAIDILYKQKIGLLDNVSKNYGDLLTEQEKIKLEDRKFQQQLVLEGVKAENNVLLERAKTAIKVAGDKGMPISDADMQKIMSGDMETINNVYGNSADMENGKGVAQIDLISRILDNKDGLASSVGVNAIGRSRLGSTIGSALAYSAGGAAAGSVIPVLGTIGGAIAGFFGGLIGEGIQVKGDVNKFSSDLGQFVSQEALNYYVSVKSKGATFGALTDKEQAWLQNASQAGGLGILVKTDKNGNKVYESNLSEDAFKDAMKNIRSATQKVIIAEQLKAEGKDTTFLKNLDNDTLNNLYTQTKNQSQATEDAYNSIINNKTSLNIPQRNNNPGNVKTTGSSTGGVAAQFALKNSDGTPKTDNFGHLIFGSVEDGFKGLVADLTAKINGKSSHIPANPTLAQLGKVYAEDGSWARGVSRILGVPV